MLLLWWVCQPEYRRRGWDVFWGTVMSGTVSAAIKARWDRNGIAIYVLLNLTMCYIYIYIFMGSCFMFVYGYSHSVTARLLLGGYWQEAGRVCYSSATLSGFLLNVATELFYVMGLHITVTCGCYWPILYDGVAYICSDWAPLWTFILLWSRHI